MRQLAWQVARLIRQREQRLLPDVYDAICECPMCRPAQIDAEVEGLDDDQAAKMLALRERAMRPIGR